MPPRETESAVTKAYIEVLTPTGEPKTPMDVIPVTFNPTEYQMGKSLQYSEHQHPGASNPVTQFGGGDGETLSMELLFDTYEDGGDVRTHTDRLDELLLVEEDRPSPPVCRVVWGSLAFRSVLQSVQKRFTMFRPDGTPVRARVNVSFKRFNPRREERERGEVLGLANTVVRAVLEGESLVDIATEQYGDPTEWRRIAAANGVTNPRDLAPGIELTVPSLEDEL